MNLFKSIGLVGALLLWSGWSLYAQPDLEQTLARAQKHIRDAEQHYAEMRYNKAKESYQFAARLYRNNNLPAYYAICYNGIGNIYIDLTRYEQAKSQGFDQTLLHLQEMKSIDPSFEVDSGLVADAYEGLGRYYSSIATTVDTENGQEVRINYNKALSYHRSALAIRQRLYTKAHHPKIALSYYYIGQCYRGFSRSDDPSAAAEDPLVLELSYLQRALNIQLKTIGGLHYQTANTYQALGNYFYETQQNYYQGYAYHQAALDIRQHIFEPNHPQIATSYLNLATYYGHMRYYDKELQYLEQALQIQLNTLGKVHAEVARSYYLLANRYRTNGLLEKAIGYYRRALSIYEQLKQHVSLEAAYTHLSLADCHRLRGEFQQQWLALEKSQGIFERVVGEQHFKLSPVLLEKGAYYLPLEQYDSVFYFYNKALHISQQQLGKQHYAVADVYDRLAELYRRYKDPIQEWYYLAEALKIRHATFEEINQNEALQPHASYLTVDDQQPNQSVGQQLHNSYRDIADFFRRQGDYRKALQYLQNALAIVCLSLAGEGNNWQINPSNKDLASNVEWLSTFERKAHLLFLLYQSEKDMAHLHMAYKTYQQGIQVINQLRPVFQSNKAQRSLRLLSTPIYEGAIRCLYRLQKQAPSDQYVAQAFQVSELSKSFTLLQALQHHLARGSSNIPDSLLDQERDLRQRLAYYSNYKNRMAATAYDSAYLTTKQHYDALVRELELNYPTYYDLKYQTRTTDLQQVQAQLKEGEVLLEYFFGKAYLYVFRVTADSCWWYEQPVPKQYGRLVYELRRALTNYNLVTEHPRWAYQSFVHSSEQFYQSFVHPFLPEEAPVQQLTVVPDGMLHYIPFEILLWRSPSKELAQTVDYKSLDFLLQRYPINYSYSATLWNRNNQRQPNNNNGQCLGLAPSIQFSPQQDSLPWTQKELEAIQQIFEGCYYYGKETSKELFKEQVEQYNIVHLATHGIVNMQNPMRSMLSFGSDSTSEENDANALYAYEIHNLSLNANLVVLSACETGFGKTVQGEGVQSLARAFLFAGTPSVVTTLWEVNDFTSAALIELFYTNLSKGMSKPEALRQAKLTFLSKTDEISGHPTYWGSFITLGSSRPLVVNRYYNSGWIVLCLGIVALGLGGWWYRLRRKQKSIS